MTRPLHRAARALALAVIAAAARAPALAHETHAGDIAIVHAFATPTLAGTTTGAVYLSVLENKGSGAERLLGASTPAASRVEIHTMAVDAQGVMRMREVDGIALAPKSAVKMRPGIGLHLMLLGVKEPLKPEARFPLTLRFEHAGAVEVQVVVEAAPPHAGAPTMRMH
jgi:periplasmic copper chaperone A